FPEAIEEMKRQLRANVEKMYVQTRKPDEPSTFQEYERLHGTDEMARLHGKVLVDLMHDSRMGRLIFGMHWGKMEFSRYEHNLLTSDRPVCSNLLPIAANHICIPISPSKMFFASETEEGEREFRRLDAKAVMRLSNNAVVERASKLVFDTNDRQLRFV